MRLALAGMGYGMIPLMQAGEWIDSGEFVSIAPGKRWTSRSTGTPGGTAAG